MAPDPRQGTGPRSEPRRGLGRTAGWWRRRLLTANFGWARVPGLVKVLSKVKVLLIGVSDRNTGLWAASIRMKLTPRPQIYIREMLRATNVMSLPSLGQTGDAARSQRLIIYYLQYYF